MGRYIDWADVVDRYGKAATAGGAQEVDSAYIVYAEAELESRLGSFFTVPFSSNNITAKDLAIDMTFARIGRFADKRNDKLRAAITSRIDDLITGSFPMVTTNGDLLFADADKGAWSNTEDYHPTFGLEDYDFTHVDSSLLQDEEDERW